MRKNIKGRLVVALALLTALLGGCGKEATTALEESSYPATEVVKEDIPEPTIEPMEESPVLDYTLPMQSPNILVGSRGYCVGQEKLAIVRGSGLPEEFTLLDGSTGEIVYRGLLENITYNEELGLYLGYADFSQVDTEGDYYLHCDIVGYSDEFSISRDMYMDWFDEIYRELLTACRRREIGVSQALLLLQTYEWYPDAFGDENFNECPDVLEIVKDWIVYVQENPQEIDNQSLYAALLAKFSYCCGKAEATFVEECLKSADKLCQQILTEKELDGDAYWALAEQYRITGQLSLRQRLKTDAKIPQDVEEYWAEDGYRYGSMTYLATKEKVDVKLCDSSMNYVMAKGEAVFAGHMEYLDAEEKMESGEILNQVLELSFANYVMNNYQYTSAAKEYLNFLMGRNIWGEDYFTNAEDKSTYLLLLGQLLEK